MMRKEIAELFIEIGERNDWPEHYEKPEILRSRIDCYAEKLMNKYDPEQMWDFNLYLERWLENVDCINDKFLLMNSLSFFTFFNRDQCNALFLEALNGPIVRWLIEKKNLNILDNDLNEILNECIQETCISAATDSANISTMRHICQLTIENPKTWRSYININDHEKERNEKIELCKKDLRDYGYKQIVVFEDFIGTGKQTKAVIDFLGNFTEWEILFIPLVICPQGDYAVSEHLRVKKYNHISYEPVSILPWELILADDRPDGRNLPEILIEIKNFAKEIFSAKVDKDNKYSWYLGFEETGALFAKYTNCPDNTLPLYHSNEDKKWKPLFPRSER